MFSWYKYLIVILVFSLLGFWNRNLFLTAPFPDLCLLVPFNCMPVGRASLFDDPDLKLFILVGKGHSFLSVACSTRVQLVFFLLLRISVNSVKRPGISIVGQLTESVNFQFIMMVIMIYLFVHDDSLTS